ncbi:MAG: hypothetical protein NZ576_01950 [Bacteroidia bacterium]|nr:hypothetical protein [Bacteroidia bacterium]
MCYLSLYFFLAAHLLLKVHAQGPNKEQAPNTPQEQISQGSCDESQFDLLARQYFEPEIKFYLNNKLLYLLNREGLFVYIDRQYHLKNEETFQKLTKDYQVGYLQKKWEGRIEESDTITIEFNAHPDMVNENPKEVRYQMFNITCIRASKYGQEDPDTLIKASEIGNNGKVAVKIAARKLPKDKIYIELGCINRIGSDNRYYQVYWTFDEKYRAIPFNNAAIH